ncbi:MAG: MarR family transcriptional regulator [Pirellulaceae bacterium]
MDDYPQSDRVLRAIRRILRKTSEYSRELARDAGLTIPQLLCLKAIGELSRESNEITGVQVARAVNLTPATVSRILDRMERSNLIVRERRSLDRRLVCISLTPIGQQRLERLPPPLQEQFVQRLAALSLEDQRTLLKGLEMVVDLMEAGSIDAAPVIFADETEPRDPSDPTASI